MINDYRDYVVITVHRDYVVITVYRDYVEILETSDYDVKTLNWDNEGIRLINKY